MTLARDILALEQTQLSTAFRQLLMKRARRAELRRKTGLVLQNSPEHERRLI